MVMDRSITLVSTSLWIAFLVFSHVSANGIFKVQHRFGSGERSLKALREHDSHRHGRMLSTMDIPLGGIPNPYKDGLYYTEISIGTPAKDYYVKVDTGSPILWVTCAGCDNCAKSSNFGMMNDSFYDPKASSTAKEIGCNQEFCSIAAYHRAAGPDCKTNTLCQYSVEYGNGIAQGYFVQDYLQYKQESDNSQSSSANSSIVFGCSTKQSENLGSTKGALDGIIGFGPSNASMISQLASDGRTKKIFSHCLDGKKGGGIFAIGEVIEPKVNTTPLVPDMSYYKVNLKEIKVGETPLNIPLDAFKTGQGKGTVIDTGSALTYLPEEIYYPLKEAILANHPNLFFLTLDETYPCFEMDNDNWDDIFPTVTLTFEDSLSLTVYPRQYIFKPSSNRPWCFSWQMAQRNTEMIILGDAALSNKLVVYDLENQVIGWVEHNCTSSIKLQDGKSRPSHQVGYHNLRSSSGGKDVASVFTLLLLSFMFQKLYF